MTLIMPKPKITQKQLDKFLKDPEILTLEAFFVILTLANVFVMYRILLNVCPFPIVVTWFQLVTCFLLASVLGEASKEFPRCAFFPRFTIEWKLYESLGLPILVYLGMITFANILLCVIPSVATFPVVVSLAVAFHHASRFLGCGQIYVPIRWLAIAIMVSGFFIGIFDKATIGFKVFPIALLFAIFSAIFRAWCLEKAMHTVEGRGNTLHNHQVAMGVLILPFVALVFGEWRFFQWMPMDFSRLYTWQTWGCLTTAGTIPFVKNIVANRMIRRTGQAPWRFLELISMSLIFVTGWIVFDMVSFVGVFASVLVISGRLIEMMDVLSQDPDARRQALHQDFVADSESGGDNSSLEANFPKESFQRDGSYVASDGLNKQQVELESRRSQSRSQVESQNAIQPLLGTGESPSLLLS